MADQIKGSYRFGTEQRIIFHWHVQMQRTQYP